VKFFAAAVFFAGGYFFSDLQQHLYVVPPKAVADGCPPAPAAEEQQMSFSPLSCVLHAHHWKKLPRRVSPLYLALSVLWAAEGQLGRALAAADLAVVLELKTTLATQQQADLLPDSLLQAYLTSPMEHPAVSSIVGGFLGQEVLKAVSGKGAPLQNIFLYDLASGDGKVEHLQAPEAAQS
jgi:ubiquitin-like 1-activating enzyme E1 A